MAEREPAALLHARNYLSVSSIVRGLVACGTEALAITDVFCQELAGFFSFSFREHPKGIGPSKRARNPSDRQRFAIFLDFPKRVLHFPLQRLKISAALVPPNPNELDSA